MIMTLGSLSLTLSFLVVHKEGIMNKQQVVHYLRVIVPHEVGDWKNNLFSNYSFLMHK